MPTNRVSINVTVWTVNIGGLHDLEWAENKMHLEVGELYKY